MRLEAISILLIGLVLLLVGSNFLVTSTERVASHFLISGFVASFFMIGVATSAPEIFISIESAIQDKTILAIGNAIGSNISNIALVFCISIFFLKNKLSNMHLPLSSFIVMSIFILATFLLMYFDRYFNITDSIIIILLFVVCMISMYKKGNDKKHTSNDKINMVNTFIYSLVGLTMLIYGSDYFIHGATEIAYLFGISAYTVGLTLTALGTSLPELAASIQSARKSRHDFIIGNIVGSNIFNIAIAMSIAGVINSAYINQSELLRDITMLLLCTFVFYFIIRTNNIFIKTVYSLTLVITYFIYISIILK